MFVKTGSAASRTSIIVQASRPETLSLARDTLLRDRPENQLTHELPIIRGFSARVDDASMDALRQLVRTHPDLSVVPDRQVSIDDPVNPPRPPTASLDLARATLGVEKVWKHGQRGEGIGIAIIDTGIAPHPDLVSRIVAFHDEVNDREQPYDDHGHGTHVSGIAAGDGSASDGKYAGMAPKANLIGVKVLAGKGSGGVSDVVAGIQWAVDNRERFNIRVMNVSIGGTPAPWRSDPMAQAVEAAVYSGITVAAAAGNSGPKPQTITSPGLAPSAITVGNLDEHWTSDRSDDTIEEVSSCGPTQYDLLEKPDVCAPGTWIYSCDTGTYYIAMTGTSMASPMVAGTAALLLQARPDASPGEIKEVLMDTAAPLKDTSSALQGTGMIDPMPALQALLQKKTADVY